MDRRFEVHKQAVLAECQVSPQPSDEWEQRLQVFADPFLKLLARAEQREHGGQYLMGLISDLESKNVESIAYLHDQDRRSLQSFIGCSPWKWQPWSDELARQVGQELGEADGVLVFDPSAFRKSGKESVGVARQWCGRFGKVDNCQIGVYMGYVSRVEQALVDMRLYLPKEWSNDPARREKAGVPAEVKFRTRHQLALEMLLAHRDKLPHAWVTGDDEMGRPTWFRRELAALGEQYLLSVPSNTIIRDLDAPAPQGGRGNPPKRPFEQVRDWAAEQPASAWTRIDVRDGHRGPLVVEAIKTRAVAKTDLRRIGPEETLVVIRFVPQGEQAVQYDHYLSNGPFETPLAEFARVAKAEHRVEECLQRSKSEAGLSDYEVRNWIGWHHHQMLSLVATWFLVLETRWGKKNRSRVNGSSGSHGSLADDSPAVRLWRPRIHRPQSNPPPGTNQPRTTLSLETT